MNDLGYLLEGKLLNLLEYLYPKTEIIHNKVIPELKHLTKARPDYYIPSEGLVVEFDGGRHYSDATVLIRDRIKDRIYTENKLTVIRIPYFLQMNTEQIKTMFGIDKEYNTRATSGFIWDGAMLPANYNTLGLERFLNFFKREDITDYNKASVLASLKIRLDRTDDSYKEAIIPETMLLDAHISKYKKLIDSEHIRVVSEQIKQENQKD